MGSCLSYRLGENGVIGTSSDFVYRLDGRSCRYNHVFIPFCYFQYSVSMFAVLRKEISLPPG